MLGNPDSAMRPGWTDLGELRHVMDSTAVDLGLILAFPHHATPFRVQDESIVDVIARYNRAMSDDLAAHGHGRFLGTAAIDPLSGPEGVRQLERDLALPHIRGIALLTNYGDITLDDPRFTPIFELARAFDVPCTVHPGSAWPSWRDAARLGGSAFLQSGLGYFLADALCIFHMAHAGVFDAATLAKLYPTHDAYVARLTASANQAVADGFMLPDDAQTLINEANASSIGKLGGTITP
jgi:predicted TIM-barrel fold metal-dependent hydrolase